MPATHSPPLGMNFQTIAHISQGIALTLFSASTADAAIQFGPPELINATTVRGLSSAACLDMNLDGVPDVITTADDYGPLRLFLGQSVPGQPFDGGRQVEVTGFDRFDLLHAEDLDGDGDQDLLVCTGDSGVVAWLPVVGGASLFEAPRTISTDAHGVEDVATGDIDGDGSTDVVVSAQDRGVIVWFRNLGAGAFATEATVTPSQYLSTAIELVDVEGDGDLDVLTNSKLSGFHWYRNLGGGVFGPQIVQEFRMETATDVLAGDLDRDGDIDYVGVGEVEGEDGTLLLYEGDGAGGFSTTRRTLVSGPRVRAATLIDADDDGDLDIAYQDESSFMLKALLNNGGTFSEVPLFAQGEVVERLDVVDTDRDGRLDLLSSDDFFHVRAVRNVGPLMFESEERIVEARASDPLEVVDLTGDGRGDLLFAFRAQMMRNEGNGQWARPIYLTDDESFRVLEVLDYDGDGVLDFVGTLDVTASDRGLGWSRAVGNGTFESPVALPVAPSDILFAPLGLDDLDGDGDIDVYGTAQFTSRTFWIENQGPTQAWTYHALPSFFRPLHMLALDLSQDGLPELIAVASSLSSGDGLGVYQNLGGGSFGPRTDVVGETVTVDKSSVADFNGDGLLDLGIRRYGTTTDISYLPSNGQGGFASPVIVDSPAPYSVPPIGLDWDDDGDADVLTLSFGGAGGAVGVSWQENLGASFAPPATITDVLLSRPDMNLYAPLRFFDLDEDGDLDPLWAERGASPVYVAWRRNQRKVGAPYCTAVPNSTGLAATLTAAGTRSAESNRLTLKASNLPTNVFGFFIASQTQGFVAMPGDSLGNICLQGAVSRYSRPGESRFSGSAGTFTLLLNLTDTPAPGGTISVLAGETWNYQAWFRNVYLGSTSNFSSALSVAFR